MVDMVVNKSDEFYVAIAKDGVHSFIFLGVNTSDGKNHLLARVGKVFPGGNDNVCKTLCKIAFFSVPGEIIDEKLDRKKDVRSPISYAAYTINYTQYLDFLGLLEEIQQGRSSFACFKPVEDLGEKVKLLWTKEKTEVTQAIPLRPEAKDVITQSCSLNLSNTCRHSALSLLHYARQDDQSAHDISSKFFRDLPLHTTLVANDGEEFTIDKITRKGKLRTEVHRFHHPDENIPFYILPAPPSSFKNEDMEPLKATILTEMYQQMEKMLKIAPESLETQQKFTLLKTLYIEKAGKNSETISDFITSISTWKDAHKKDLSKLRETYFFDCFFKRQSATEKMFNRFTEYFEKQSPKETLCSGHDAADLIPPERPAISPSS